ncbi:DUF4199 domain-containing protein [Hymenobacter taeanensis]|uniref:DUF4199 domain-containing protein n=1 Tax=Hymenobacter taeanensis TaxID=2735321 RepID=A0A6M6BBS0_9BACT|nr:MULTISPECIES: DUF4199 domain-containing protein [Hymenobacter]QJX45597.1 DUF4199 domain-containing protein [Hymenobacter taeanensis]UOQ81152.1 DUF4199 domain-containing protein [Hymenobacter sp. 5414T-23]
MENTTTPVSPSSAGIRYGLITGLVTVIVTLAINMSGLEQSPAKWLSFLVLLAGIWMAHTYFKQHNNGFMSYSQGLGIGSLLSAITGLLNGIVSYVYINFVDTEFLTRSMERARAEMEAQGKLNDEQIDQALGMAAKFTNGPFMLIGAILGTLLFGFIFSLIISAITKHTRPEFE